MRGLSFFCTLLFIFTAGASTRELKESEIKKIIIVGTSANIQVTGTGLGLKLTLDPMAEEHFVVEESEGFIWVKEKSKGKSEKILPRIELIGKAIPIEVHLQEGSLLLNKWTKESFLHLQKGKVTAQDNQAHLIVHTQKGEVAIAHHKGSIEIDNFQANLVLRDNNGDLNLRTYQGDISIDKQNGNSKIMSTLAHTKYLNGEGSLQFELGKGILSTQKFKGRIEGFSQEANISIQLAPDEDVSIKSHSGRVQVTTPTNSAVAINLQNQEGEIYLPTYLKLGRDGTRKFLRSRLRGDVSKSSIFIQSQEGNIFVK